MTMPKHAAHVHSEVDIPLGCMGMAMELTERAASMVMGLRERVPSLQS
jgi:hypothetical protein